MQSAGIEVKKDEQAIRALVDKWLTASKAGDIETVLGLMADDVIFMVPGKEPFGKEEFAAQSTALEDVRIESESNIQEIEVAGDWGWMRNHLKVKMVMPDGQTQVRSGYVLAILRRVQNDKWVIARDANLLAPEGK